MTSKADNCHKRDAFLRQPFAVNETVKLGVCLASQTLVAIYQIAGPATHPGGGTQIPGKGQGVVGVKRFWANNMCRFPISDALAISC